MYILQYLFANIGRLFQPKEEKFINQVNMENNESEIINNICDEQNFEELLFEITSTVKSNKLNKILNDIENDNRLNKELKKSIYADFFEYVTEINQSYISGMKKVFCLGAEKAINKIKEKNNMKGSSNMGIKTRVIIADDNVHICKFIQASLNKHNDIEVLGVANTDEDEIKMIEELKPEIVITDLVRNHKYTGLDIIKNYFEKKSPVKFLVVSADGKQEVIKDGLEVAGYIEKAFSFDYELIYDELIRIKKQIIDEEYNNWDKKYHTLEHIDLYSVFDEDERATLNKLGIEIKNRKYTEYEFELIIMELGYYMEIDEDDLDVVETLKSTRKYIADKGVTEEEFDKIINKIDGFSFL